MIIVWGCADLAGAWRIRRFALALLGAVAVLSLGVVTWHQNTLWRNSIVLFEHTLKVTERNFPAHMNFGIALASAGREEEAVRHFQQALDTGHPKPQEVHYNLGQAYAAMARNTEAVNHFETASSLDPEYVDPHIGLGTLFLRLCQWDQAQKEWSRALELNPRNKKALNNIGVVMLHKGETENAILWFHAALEVDPDYLMAKKNLNTAIEKRARKASQ